MRRRQPTTRCILLNSTWIVLGSSFVLSPEDPTVFILQLGVVLTHAVCELVRHWRQIFILRKGKSCHATAKVEQGRKNQLHFSATFSNSEHFSCKPIPLDDLVKDSPC